MDFEIKFGIMLFDGDNLNEVWDERPTPSLGLDERWILN